MPAAITAPLILTVIRRVIGGNRLIAALIACVIAFGESWRGAARRS